MAASARPRRSVLYMPGSNARALDKGRMLPADGLILDLEDAVAPDAKDLARRQIKDALDQGGYGGREIAVRVNALDSDWGNADLKAAASMKLDAVLLPKVETAQMVVDAIAVLDGAGGDKNIPIWCMMETPLGVLNAREIAFADPRVACFVMGTSDLAKDLHALHTMDRTPFITSLGLCLLAGRAAGLAVLDGVYLDLSDDQGFLASCQQGLEFGFDGKTLIHPKTINAANQAFAPTETDINWSKRIIDAHTQAQQQGQGVVVVDGKLIENLHIDNANRLVSMASAIADLEAANR